MHVRETQRTPTNTTRELDRRLYFLQHLLRSSSRPALSKFFRKPPPLPPHNVAQPGGDIVPMYLPKNIQQTPLKSML